MQEWQEMLGPHSQSPLQVAASLCGQRIPLPSSVHAVGWPEGQSCLMCFSSYVKNKLDGEVLAVELFFQIHMRDIILNLKN